MINLSNKKVLVTGGSGMIGRALVSLLKKEDCDITVADLYEPRDIEGINYAKVDLRYFDQCAEVCRNKDIIFHLAGIKGSPRMCADQPLILWFLCFNLILIF